jgi:hypothetical protein
MKLILTLVILFIATLSQATEIIGIRNYKLNQIYSQAKQHHMFVDMYEDITIYTNDQLNCYRITFRKKYKNSSICNYIFKKHIKHIAKKYGNIIEVNPKFQYRVDINDRELVIRRRYNEIIVTYTDLNLFKLVRLGINGKYVSFESQL